MSVSFVIDAWAAYAPGLATPASWSQWAAAPWLPQGEPQVALTAVAPMLRRRFAPLGRIAAQVAFELAGDAASSAPDASIDADSADSADSDSHHPTVFASRYGEAGRCLDLLADHARGDALSPTAFGLSVHNAIGAMIALARTDRSNSTAIAAGRATAAAGVVEAVGLLDDGASAASLVVYDAPLPAGYAPFEDEPSAHFAWAWRLRRPHAGERALHLDWLDAPSAPSVSSAELAAPLSGLPASLQTLWFGLSQAPAFEQHVDGRTLRWSRDD